MKTLLTKKKVLIGAAVFTAVLAAGICMAVAWGRIAADPMGLFEQTPEPTPEPTARQTAEPAAADTPEPTPAPTPTPTPDPYEVLAGQADKSLMKDTLNVLLIGVDYAEERVDNDKEYVNKNFNSDVMLNLAINFKEKKVDMISLPRDSYAKIANLDGIYKLNFALQAGGGMTDEGFMNVCKSVQELLGGVPVNYYIAVTMPVVKELTDAIGGVEYDVDVAFTINGRSYEKGLQHMDGQAVLDYCRVRKGDISEKPGDLNRVNRQKQILLAVFKKLQSEATILDVPKLLSSMQGKVSTNLNFAQLAALAVFGRDLEDENITMRTMAGSYASVFNRNYVLIDQNKRVELIEEVYGIAAEKQYKYAPTYAKLLWAYMQGNAWLKTINATLAKDAALPEDQRKLINAELNARLAESMTATQTLLGKYKKRVNSSKPTAKTAEVKELSDQAQAMKTLASEAFAAAGYEVKWTVTVNKKGQPVMKE